MKKTHTKYNRNWIGRITGFIQWEEDVLLEEVCNHFWIHTDRSLDNRFCKKCKLQQIHVTNGGRSFTWANYQT